MAKKIKKAVKAKPKKAKAAKKIAKRKTGKAKALKKVAGRGVTMAGPMMAKEASMTLVDYRIEPSTTVMQGVAITFKHVITVNGEDGVDTFRVQFSQITSPNWLISGSLNRSFPFNGVGIHKFNDGLAFSLKPNGTRVKGEVFTVRAKGWLISRPVNGHTASITVTVK